MNLLKTLKAIVCRLAHTRSWEKRGKSMKDHIGWSGRKTYSYWCPECSDLRITGKGSCRREAAERYPSIFGAIIL